MGHQGDQAEPITRVIEDRYVIDRKIGEGATAETFLARDREDSGRLVVIKSLHVEKLDGWKFFELFEREAQTLAALDHPGVPEFVEWFASKSDDGRPRFHIVQEYVAGRSLADVIERGGMAETEFAQLALGMLDILDYLHRRTPPVFHRDIKPSNIIIREMGTPVLVDFGSVTSGWREADERGSTVAGTHGYMPPEQYMGQVSARSDLYGLGATLLHVASGKGPTEYSFEEGRINVPTELPVDRAVRAALQALLEPAPKDRPKSARAARDVFVSETSTALVPTASTAMTKRDGARVLKATDAPRFVDLGPPPRDPSGEFRAVYRWLCPPWTWPSTGAHYRSRAPARASTTVRVAAFIFVMVCTFGLWPLLRLFVGSEDRVRRNNLFEAGVFAPAEITGMVGQSGERTRVDYEFAFGDELVRASSMVQNQDAKHMHLGERYGVLYDAADPSNNVFVYI